MKHIVILFTDQQRRDTIAALGNEKIQTPHLDALVRESVVFDHCFTPSPVCVPARLSLFSGQYPARTGCNNNNAETVYTGSGFYAQLTKAGYDSYCVGKMHHLVDPYGPMGFRCRISQEELADPRDDYTKFILKHHPNVFDYHGMRSEMYYVPQISQLSAQDHPTQWIGDQSVACIQKHESDRPLFLMASFVHPHPPYCPPAPWNKLYREDPPEPFIPSEEELAELWPLIGDRCSCRRLMMSRQDVLRMKNFYYACVSFVDYQVGRIVQALKEKGIYDDTLILFASDHGDMMGDYQAVGKRSMVDASSRIPFFIRYPGQIGQHRKDPCSLVDVAPTLLRYAQIPFDAGEYDGVDLFGAEHHEEVYSQHGCGKDGTYMVTNGVDKLVYHAKTDRYYYFENLPEQKDCYRSDNPRVLQLRERLDAYRASDRNQSLLSHSYEPVTKKHPHYPGRMDQALWHDAERCAIPEEYQIDLG
ncbi:MAG: sulfatase [Lawsonibacter sp.]|jgi:arylsulfatase